MISASLGPLAQLVEQEAFNLCVIGSNPIRPTIPDFQIFKTRDWKQTKALIQKILASISGT